MPIKNPAHPGRVVRTECLEPLGLSATAGAKDARNYPAGTEQYCEWQVGNQSRNGDPIEQGFWEHAGNVAAHATGL